MKKEQINLRISHEEKKRIEYLSQQSDSKSLSAYIIDSCLGINDNFYFKKINVLSLNPKIDFKFEISDHFMSEKVKSKNFQEDNNNFNYQIYNSCLEMATMIKNFYFPISIIHYSSSFWGDYIKKHLEKFDINQLQLFSEIPTPLVFSLKSVDKNYQFEKDFLFLNEIVKEQLLKIIKKFNKGEIVIFSDNYNKKDENYIFKICQEISDNKNKLVWKGDNYNFFLKIRQFDPIIVTFRISDLKDDVPELLNAFNNWNLDKIKQFMFWFKDDKTFDFVLFVNNYLFILDHFDNFYVVEDEKSNFKDKNLNVEEKFIDRFLSVYSANFSITRKEALKFAAAAFFYRNIRAKSDVLKKINSKKSEIVFSEY